MENLDLLIKLAIILFTILIIVVDYKICCEMFDFFEGIKTAFIYLREKKKGTLHNKVSCNPFFERYQKICLLNGLPKPTFEEYEAHFVDGGFYYK